MTTTRVPSRRSSRKTPFKSRQELEAMEFPELRALGARLGVTARSKTELLDRILSASGATVPSRFRPLDLASPLSSVFARLAGD